MFTLIVYKPDSEDYCRGCRMAGYSSALFVKNMLTEKDLEFSLSDYLFKNKNLDYNETGYSFWIFKDGIKVWGDGYSCWDGHERHTYDSPEYWEHYVEYEQDALDDESEITGIMKKAESYAQQRHIENLTMLAKKQLEEQQEQIKIETAKRRRQFEELKKEFKEI